MRTRFDQFAKQMTGKALAARGVVRTDEEVSPDAGHIDIWFTPHGFGTSTTQKENENEKKDDAEGAGAEALAVLGMLGRMAKVPFTMEPFHGTPDGAEVMGCVCKHHYFRSLLQRRPSTATIRGQKIRPGTPKGRKPRLLRAASTVGDDPPTLPVQWIVSSGRPDSALAGLCFDERRAEGWGPGVYEGPPLTHTKLVVLAELPATRDTLLLRLMGAGRVLTTAIDELLALPIDAPEGAFTLPLLVKLRIKVPKDPAKRTEDDEEFIMATRDILDVYNEKLERKGLKKGRKEGRKEGSCEAHRVDLLDVFTTRFGPPPASVAEIIGRTTDTRLLRTWLKLVAGSSAKDAIAAILAAKPTGAKSVAA